MCFRKYIFSKCCGFLCWFFQFTGRKNFASFQLFQRKSINVADNMLLATCRLGGPGLDNLPTYTHSAECLTGVSSATLWELRTLYHKPRFIPLDSVMYFIPSYPRFECTFPYFLHFQTTKSG